MGSQTGISEIHYERVFNLGNYESERLGLTMVINDDGTDIHLCFESLVQMAEREHDKMVTARRQGGR